ncbi:MAG: YqgE/AlgH family protein [Gammaproteobacteria bacterium]
MTESLANSFLIAMPGLGDPHFYQTVTLICEHNQDGALGVVVNRSTDLKLGELLEQLNLGDISEKVRERTVNYGGPVQMDRGFILHEPVGAWESTLSVGPTLGLTASLDILTAIAHGAGPQRNLIALGYAGWDAGQLEQEIADNAWLVAAGDPNIVFDAPEAERWRIAAASLGVDLNLISNNAGHA